jgi:PAS domain S-box-containing protein
MEALLGAFLVTVSVFPALYVFLFRRMVLHMTKDKEAQEKLQRDYDELEIQVAERAATLTGTNEPLRTEITERKRAEEETKRYAEQYSVIKATDLFGYWLVDENGKLLDVNDSYCRMSGYTREELLYFSVLDLEAIDKPEDVSRRRQKMIETGNDQFESKHKAKDGRVFNVEASVAYWSSRKQFIAFIRDITEHKRDEEAFSEERSLLRALMENIPDHIYFKDAGSRFIKVNKAQASMFGLSDPMEAIGKTDFDFFTEEHARPAYESEQEIIRSGRPLVDLEEKEDWPDGRETWVSTTKVPLRDVNGQIIGTFGLSRDVTERKRAEQELRRSEETYRVLAESSPAMIYLVGTDGRLLFVNSLAASQLRTTPEKLVGKHLAEIFPPNIADQHLHNIRLVLESKKQLSHEILEQFCSRSAWIDVRLSPVCDEHGNPIAVLGLLYDITDRKNAEEALRRSEERYRRITDGLTDYLYTVRVENGRPVGTTHSHACEKVTGYTTEEFAANPNLWIEMVVPEDRDMVMSHAKKVLSREDVPPIEHRIVRKDGEIRCVRDTAIPQIGSSGMLVSYDGVISDITEHKRAEAEREKLIGELQHSLENIKTLGGLLPICANCKRIRDDKGYWSQVEGYIMKHTEAKFSHGICPECMETLYGAYKSTETK